MVSLSRLKVNFSCNQTKTNNEQIKAGVKEPCDSFPARRPVIVSPTRTFKWRDLV